MRVDRLWRMQRGTAASPVREVAVYIGSPVAFPPKARLGGE